MASFADLSANLKLNITDFSNKLKSASTQMNKFAADINGKTVEGMKELNKQTNAWGLNLKSVSSVVSGIVISQAFYKILQSVQAATNAVWEFSKELEYAQIAYSNLFGDVSLANEFINVLKDFAAETPFSFTESERAAKRLLAYGIEYKNVMYVMQGVLSAASIQGDSAKIEAISRAFGQIYTYGKLMTQEVRQLSEAGIPAFEILQEELGLTQEQLRNLGNEGIPASEAINALVDGIQKRFGNVTVAAAKTISGIISNIQDNATMLFSGLFNPLTVFIKSALVELGEFFYTMREIFELKGAGGVFEALFPPELHGIIRQFIANLGNLLMSVLRLVYAVSGLLRPAFEAFMMVFNAFAPIITTVINVFASLVQLITQNATAMRVLTTALAAAAAMWVVFKVKALATAVVTAVVNGISKALAGLHAILTFVVAHPFWALLIGLTGIIVGISFGFDTLSQKISNFFKSLTQFNGIDPDKVLLPSQKERANDLDKFNKKLDGTSDAMDDLADSTGKATKAAKGLLSFDEVFKLNEPDEGTDSGIQVPSIEIPELDLGDLGGEAYIPEVPDFSNYMDLLKNGFLDNLKGAWEEIKKKAADIISTALGALFGGLLGALIGGKIGGLIGALVGGLVGYFWNKLADYFGLSPDQKVRAGIIGGIGAILGAILGGILGGPLGAKIGAIIGGLVGSFWGIFAEALGVIPEQHISTMRNGALTGLSQFLASLAASLSKGLVATFTNGAFSGFSKMVGFSFKDALTGALKQGAIGAIVGLGVGVLSNALSAWIAGELDLTEQDLKNSASGQFVGNIVGTIAGMILGGPVGSLIGGALGQLAGSIIGEFWAYMSNTLKGTVIGGAAGLPIGALVGTLVGSLGGPLGAALGAAIGAALGAVVGLIIDYWEPIKQFFADAGQTIADAVGVVIDGFGSIGEAISSFFSGDFDFTLFDIIGSTLTTVIENVKAAFPGLTTILSDLGTSASTIFGDLGLAVSTVWNDIKTAVSPVLTDIWTAITTVWTDIKTAVTTVLTDLWTAISTVWNDIKTAVTTVLTDIWSAISTVWNDISTAVSTVCDAVWGVIQSIWYLIRDLIIKVLTDVWNAFIEWFAPIAETVSTVLQNVWNTVTTIFNNVLNTIKQVLQNVWTTVSTIFNNIYNVIKPIVTNIYNTIKQVFTNVYNTVKTIFTNVYNTIRTIITNAYNSVKQVFINIYNTIKTYITNAYNSVKSTFTSIYNSVKNAITNMYNSVKNGISNIYTTFTNWVSNLWDNVFGKLFGWIDSGISKLREFFGLSSEASSINIPSSSGTSSMAGHATGGIFNREHVARFAEGNKAEAIIPLENASAMQPFVNAVADGLTASLAPMLASFNGNSQQLQPLYVGTLIADEKSLKELERKMEIIRLQESKR